MASNNTTQTAVVLFKDGYDMHLYGLDNGLFYYFHVTSIVCLTVSIICALYTIISSFRSHPDGFFTGWTKGERLAVYLSICDLLLSISLLMNHLHILITKTLFRPKELCSFFGFIMTEFVLAQILIVNVVAINVFTTMFFGKNFSFGKFDSGILLWSFGVPFIGALIAAILDKFGPVGIACFFDAINGRVAYLVLITIPITTIMVVNVLLYILTFIKIRIDVRAIRQHLGNMASTAGRHIRAARNMSMFVVAFFVQWSCLALSGVWIMFEDDTAEIPEGLKFILGIFTNLGGVLNLIVYLAVFRKTRSMPNIATSMEPRKPHTVSDNNKKPAQINSPVQVNEEFQFPLHELVIMISTLTDGLGTLFNIIRIIILRYASMITLSLLASYLNIPIKHFDSYLKILEI